MTSISLKAQNIVPLSLLVAVQLLAVYSLNYPVLDLNLLDFLKETSGVMLVIGVLAGWLSYLLPADLKNSLVFLRWKNVLPGHRFIQLCEDDARIDVEKLKARVPSFEELRSDHDAQNSYWYREFYRPLANQSEVASVHKAYLLYRDAAAVSLIMVALFSTAKLVLEPKLSDIAFYSIWIFCCTALGCVVAGSNAGRRLVTTGVAINLCKQQ
ncbi:conserved hypothetical protein [Hahella chejuensis KCTC 2396]|uniref:Uncharacterized protein n=1 Tax=Hahella chejuensis (strain KCTC 2396) TaxID=349521 RepID=Q2SCB6_HAHCH|nr:hypothetical protein [Hahella chejuensis]ABC31708.1 conserved hypothetical protein [Hahella chejuensis KCTC 2396]